MCNRALPGQPSDQFSRWAASATSSSLVWFCPICFISLDGVSCSKQAPLFVPFFLFYFKDITSIHTALSSDVDLSLFRCLSPLSSLCSFPHCPCCGQLLIVHHVVTSVPATVIADVTAKIGGDVFKAEWSTCVFDIISHQKGFPAIFTLPLFKGKFKSRCDSQDGGQCVQIN